MCKCGHLSSYHQENAKKECAICSCDSYERYEHKEIQQERWIDKPDRLGIWYWFEWNGADGYSNTERIIEIDKIYLRPNAKWKYIGPIPDPPPASATDAEIAQAAIEFIKVYRSNIPHLDKLEKLERLVERK